MMKKLLFLFVAVILTLLSACNEDVASFPSEIDQSIAESSIIDKSQGSKPETSEELTLEEKYPAHNIEPIGSDRYLALRKGYVNSDREQHIINADGEIIKTFNCESIFKVDNNPDLLYVKMNDRSAYFIDTDGERIDDTIWDELIPWEAHIDRALLGVLNGEYFLLDQYPDIIEQISTEPALFEEYDGLTIANAFRNYDFFYGVMKDGEFIIEPQFRYKPIIKNGGIVFNKNVFDALASEGYIYDYSGKLVKKINGKFDANQGFDYIIQCERNDQFLDDATFSILDYSGKTLYTAPMGEGIGIISYNTSATRVAPYHVKLNGEIVHLEKLIDGIEYPPVKIRDYANAKDISPEQLPIIQTPYLVGNFGRQYHVTDELKISVKEKLLEYLELANISFNEKNLSYVDDAVGFFAKYVNGDITVLSYCDSIDVETSSGDARNPLSDPAVKNLCKMTFSNMENLKLISDTDGVVFTIYEKKDTVAETMLSMTKKYLTVFTDGSDILSVRATDRSDKSIFPNYTFNAISYDEAAKELRKGNFIMPPYSSIEFDCKSAKIEGVEFEYIIINECICQKCFDVGYYIPCYSFYVRDKESPEYYGEVYVPAIDINELNEYLGSLSQPHINHYWTAE